MTNLENRFGKYHGHYPKKKVISSVFTYAHINGQFPMKSGPRVWFPQRGCRSTKTGSDTSSMTGGAESSATLILTVLNLQGYELGSRFSLLNSRKSCGFFPNKIVYEAIICKIQINNLWINFKITKIGIYNGKRSEIWSSQTSRKKMPSRKKKRHTRFWCDFILPLWHLQ